jgi:hypothetical protein
VGPGVPSSISPPPLPLLHPAIVIATCSTTVPPVTLVIVVPVLVVTVVVIKLGLFGIGAKPVTLQLPFSTMGVVAGACVRDWKRVKEPLPLS